jgi:hypothetical protein
VGVRNTAEGEADGEKTREAEAGCHVRGGRGCVDRCVCVAGIVSVGVEVSKKRLDRLIRIAFIKESVLRKLMTDAFLRK